MSGHGNLRGSIQERPQAGPKGGIQVNSLVEFTAKRNRINHYQGLIDSGAAELDAVMNPRTGKLAGLAAAICTRTREEAASLAARFPRSLRVKATRLSGTDYYDHEVRDDRYSCARLVRDGIYSYSWTVGYVTFRVDFTADGVNGGVNETGLKRYRSFRRNARRLGIPVIFVNREYGNSVTSEDQLEALLARCREGRQAVPGEPGRA